MPDLPIPLTTIRKLNDPPNCADDYELVLKLVRHAMGNPDPDSFEDCYETDDEESQP